MTSGEIQQEASQLLGRGVREPNGSHFRDRRMIAFTELLRHSQRCLAVLAQKEQEVLPRDEIRLCRFDYVGGKLVRFSRNRRRQAQHFSRFRDSKNGASPVARRGGALDAAAASDEESSRRLPFYKDSSPFRIGSDRHHG